MLLKEVYEKYKHLDSLLSLDIEQSFSGHILYDLWMAIKEHMEAPNE